MAHAQDPQRVVELSEGVDEESSELNTSSLHIVDNSDDTNADAMNIAVGRDEGQAWQQH